MIARRLLGLAAATVLMSACGAHGSHPQAKDAPEPITGRGLTAEVLSLAAPLNVSSYSGLDAVPVPGSSTVVARSFVHFDNDEALDQMYVETAHQPGNMSAGMAKSCTVLPGQLDLGCRTEPDGSVTVLAQRPADSPPQFPLLTGYAIRPDGSGVMLEVYGSHPSSAAVSLARSVLSDPLIAAVTSSAVNDDGTKLQRYTKITHVPSIQFK